MGDAGHSGALVDWFVLGWGLGAGVGKLVGVRKKRRGKGGGGAEGIDTFLSECVRGSHRIELLTGFVKGLGLLESRGSNRSFPKVSRRI